MPKDTMDDLKPVPRNRVRRVLSGAGGGKSGGSPIESANTLQTNSILRLIEVLGEGPIKGVVQVYFNETPRTDSEGNDNFKGVTVETRLGLPDQAPVEGFSSQEADEVIDTIVNKDTPVLHTITDPDTDAARVTIKIPALFEYKDNGDMVGAGVSYRIQYRPNGGSWIDIPGSPFIISNEKNTSPAYLPYRFSLTGAAPWDIRVLRESDDTTDNTKYQNSIYFYTLSQIIEQKFSYPDTAYLAIRASAQQFGDSIPSRAALVDGLICRVPTNFDAETRTYTGVWNGTFKESWTDCPAWCLYELITNSRWGLGDFVSSAYLDPTTLYSISQYSAAHVDNGEGGTEPRFTFNAYLGTRQEAYDMVNAISSVFRGMVYWSMGAAMFAHDAPAEPILTVARANTINGDFSYQGASILTIHNRVNVTYNNPANFYKRDVVTVNDPEHIAKYGLRATDIIAFGCTSKAQAVRAGRWLMYTERMEADILTYTAGPDHVDAVPGSVVRVMDPSVMGVSMGGRVRAYTTNSVTLDREVEILSGATYELVVHDKNRVLHYRAITNAPGATTAINTDVALPILTTNPLETVWALRRTDGPDTLYRLLNLREVGNHQYQVTAMRHNPDKYAIIENGYDIPAYPVALLPTGALPVPSDLQVREQVIKTSGTQDRSSLSVSVLRPSDPRVRGLELRYRRLGQEWQTVDLRYNANYVIETAAPGDRYQFECRAYDAISGVSEYTETVNIQVNGVPVATDVPNVTDHLVTSGIRSIDVTWTNPTITDFKEVEVFMGSTATEGDAVLILATPAERMTLSDVPTGATRHVWLRVVAHGTPLRRSATVYAGYATTEAIVSEDIADGAVDLSKAGVSLIAAIDAAAGSAAGDVLAAQAAADAAAVSATNAATAQGLAQTANTNAQSAMTAGTAARDAALGAQTAAEAAQALAESANTTAQTAATTATAQATSATSSKNAAATSATAANTAKTAAQTAQTAAVAAKDLAVTAQTAAQTAQTAAEAAQATALTNANAAGTSATNAATSATSANTAKVAAETAQGLADAAKTAAQTARDTSLTYRDASLAAKTAAETAQTNATTQATNAAGSATAAAGSATSAGTSATNAGNSATAAAASAVTAGSQATNAASSAAAAVISASGASTSATNAATSASAASTSAATATTQAGNASTSATQAATSATNAAGSATSASTSASTATTAATNAGNSASAASTSATNAASSATAAGTSATAAATSATTASTQAGLASTSASQAATSATSAAGSATSASTSATTAASTQAAVDRTVAGTFPSDFSEDGRFWTSTISGAPGARGGLSAVFTFEDVAGEGRCAAILAPQTGNRIISGKAYVSAITGRKYRLSVRVMHVGAFAGNSATCFRMNLRKMTSTYTNNGDAFATNPTFAAPDTWYTYVVEHSYTATDPYLCFFAYVNANLDTAGPKILFSRVLFEDITSEAAAAASASAAVTSATNAATSATAAGTSATAAAASATTASTKAGEASTSATSAASSASTATTQANNAATSATTAANSATNATTQAGAAATSATNAATSATNAGTSATAASNSAVTAGTAATNAGNSATAAAGSASAASTSASNASTSATSAGTYASNAANSATTAATSATNAGNSATAASGSATTAATQAGNAATSATAAAASATTASTQAGNAATSATSAATSATSATASMNAAATSATTAATQATNAAGSASAASTSATSAATSATNAGNSASAAATSATTASTKAGEASTSATSAATSANTATTQANNAATSATTAANAATTATTQAGAAATSATNAATSATNAGTSATSAASSAVTAQTAVMNAPILPYDFRDGLTQWVSSRVGSPYTLGAPTGATIVTDAEMGQSAEMTWNSAGASFLHRGTFVPQAGRAYRITVRFKLISLASGTDTVLNIVAVTMDSAYVLVGTAVAGSTTFAPSSTTVYELTRTYSDVAATGVDMTLASLATAPFARIGLRAQASGQGAVVRIGMLRVEDVTATLAAGNAATNAAGSASAAATSASSANTSATNAGAFSASAATSATNAANSATSAAGSATAANTSATTAATQATNAGNSATAASNSATAAATQATNAANSASAANTSASNAAASNTAAGGSATAAANSATAASTSAGNASTSASNAASSATSAAGSATSASTSATTAATTLTSAQTIVASLFPYSFDQNGTFFSSSIGGAPSAKAALSASITFVTDAQEGIVANTDGPNASNKIIVVRSYINAVVGRRYRVTARARHVGAFAGTSATCFKIYLRRVSSAYVHGTDLTAPTQTFAAPDTWYDFVIEATYSGTDPYLSAFCLTTTGLEAGTTVQVSRLMVQDVTDIVAAANSASAAATSATNAAASQTAAGASATAAQTARTAAETAQAGAATSATSASTSATNAAGSASSASTSATNAANSASAAAGSATAANTSASNASTSATAAGTSATAAQAARTAAETAQAGAATSATAASTSATNAAGSASAAATSATNAANSATTSGNSATAAGTSASNAATSATDAATSATSAAASLVSARAIMLSSPILPSTFDNGYAYWTSTIAGAPGALSDPAGRAIVTDTNMGPSDEFTWTGNSQTLATRGVLPIVAGHVYRVTIKFKLMSSAGGVTVSIFPRAHTLNADYTTNTNTTGGAVTITPDVNTVQTITRTYSNAAATGVDQVHASFGTAAWVRMGLGATASGKAAVIRIGSILVEDITQQLLSANSATAASGSASNAATSATTAGASATAAAASATTATTQAGNASTSATSAATSASTATTQANNAATSATTAATQATNAAGSASAASTSATAAATSATAAGNSATSANTSATTATTKAGEASTSATNAASSATSAAGSATAAGTSATTAANASLASVATVSLSLPSGFDTDATFWGATAIDPPATQAALGVRWTFANLSGVGRAAVVADLATVTADTIYQRGVIVAVPGRKYRIRVTCRYSGTVTLGANPATIYMNRLDASYAWVSWAATVHFTPTNTMATYEAVYTAVSGDVFLRAALRRQDTMTGTGDFEVLAILTEDVTSELAAASSATAAGTSATNAATSATAAGTSATTATTQATNAATSASGASTSAASANTSAVNASSSASSAAGSSASALDYRNAAARMSSGGVSKNPVFNRWASAIPDDTVAFLGGTTAINKITSGVRYVNAVELVGNDTSQNRPILRLHTATNTLDCVPSPQRVLCRMEVEFVSGSINGGAYLTALWSSVSGGTTAAVQKLLSDFITADTGKVQTIEWYVERPASFVAGTSPFFYFDITAVSNALGATRAACTLRVHRMDFEVVTANSITEIFQRAKVSIDNIETAAIGLRAQAGSGGATLELVALNDPVGGAVSGARIAADNIILDGSVKTEHLEATELSSLIATIGLFKSAASGARVEIQDDKITVYRADGSVAVKLGNLA